MTYTNQSCAASGPILRKSIGQGRRLWEEWVLDDLKSSDTGSGGYLATIRTRANREIINCIGNLEPGNFAACEAKLLQAHQVTLRDHTAASQNANKPLWRIIPISKRPAGVYNIILNSRLDGCFRFLGASSSCDIDQVSLYRADDSSGLQQWTFTPVYNPANVLPSSSPPIAKIPPPKATKIPKVAFTLAFPQVDVDSFLEDDKLIICQSLMTATNYPQSLLSCSIDKVQAAASVNLRKRRLQSSIPAAVDSGVVVQGGMLFNVASSSQTTQAVVAAENFKNTIQNPIALNQALGESVTGSPVILVTATTQLVVPPTSSTASPAPSPATSSPSPTTSSPSPASSSPAPVASPAIVSPSPIVSPSNPSVPVPIPVVSTRYLSIDHHHEGKHGFHPSVSCYVTNKFFFFSAIPTAESTTESTAESTAESTT